MTKTELSIRLNEIVDKATLVGKLEIAGAAVSRAYPIGLSSAEQSLKDDMKLLNEVLRKERLEIINFFFPPELENHDK